jgi:16S rRNA (cytidine1402-2'-O)-methyltransferase
MLFIVATPIGNLDDVSARALATLRDADVIACEDTRRTRILLDHYKIPIPRHFVSYREHQEGRTGEYLLELLKEDKKVALCSDGGFPGISDPGYRLVRQAIEQGIAFEVIPGASAVPVALVASGLPSSSFTFKGFPPRKGGPNRRFFEEEKDMPHTLIVFESPFRVAATLAAALEALGDRQAAVCIELTKKFERVSRGFLSDLKAEFADKKIKGEVTIVIAGNNPKFCRETAASVVVA